MMFLDTWEIASTPEQVSVLRHDGVLVGAFMPDEEGIEQAAAFYGELLAELSAGPSGANAPYKIESRGGGWVVVNNTGLVKASFTDRAKAVDYLRALYANVPGAEKRAAKVKFTGTAKAREAAAAAVKNAKKPYGDVAYADPGYQSDGQKRYPIDTPEHCRAAMAYISQTSNAGKYSAAQLASIKAQIQGAMKKFGIGGMGGMGGKGMGA